MKQGYLQETILERELRIIQMETFTKVNLRVVVDTVKENIFGLTEIHMKEIGAGIRKME